MVDKLTIMVRYPDDMTDRDVRRMRERIVSALSPIIGPLQVIDALNSDYLDPTESHRSEHVRPHLTSLDSVVLRN